MVVFTGRDLYESAVEAFPEEHGVIALPWGELPGSEREDWEQQADELNAKVRGDAES